MSLSVFHRPLNRRRFLHVAAGSAAAAVSLSALGSLGATRAYAAETTVTPRYGAGIFNVDPSQSGVSQSRSVVVTGDIRSLPLHMAL
jgi:hypothetical protein